MLLALNHNHIRQQGKQVHYVQRNLTSALVYTYVSQPDYFRRIVRISSLSPLANLPTPNTQGYLCCMGYLLLTLPRSTIY
jgi:hypothetical protein